MSLATLPLMMSSSDYPSFPRSPGSDRKGPKAGWVQAGESMATSGPSTWACLGSGLISSSPLSLQCLPTEPLQAPSGKTVSHVSPQLSASAPLVGAVSDSAL